MTNNLFDQLDFGEFEKFIQDDDITDISYCNDGQIWIRSLKNGSLRIENHGITNAAVEKLAFQCSNVMGTTFNTAKPFLDAESSELRMNFVHDSVATNGIALVIRKTPAKIRLKEEKLLEDDYITKDIHDFLIKCVLGHCNIMVCGETGSGKTEFVKYLASHTKESEKIITIEDTLELHLDRIYPNRDIVSMKTNNIASYSDVLVTCMRQNPKWILLSEVRSAEAVSAVRNSISSGHNILSTIHSDKASAIPHRLYSLMETDLDVDQFLNTIYRYIQLGVHIKAYYSKEKQKFHREIDEITEFYVDEDNKPVYNVIFQRSMTGKIMKKEISKHLREYLENQNINLEAPVESKGLDSDLDKLVEAQAEINEKFSVKEEVEEKPINYIDSAINFDKPIPENNNINNVSIGGNANFNNENQIPLTFKVEEEADNQASNILNNDISSQLNQEKDTVSETVFNPSNIAASIPDNFEIPLPGGIDIINNNEEVSLPNGDNPINLGSENILNNNINQEPIQGNIVEISATNQAIQDNNATDNIEISLPSENVNQLNLSTADVLTNNISTENVQDNSVAIPETNSVIKDNNVTENIEIPLPSANDNQNNLGPENILNNNINQEPVQDNSVQIPTTNSMIKDNNVTENIEIPLPVTDQVQLEEEKTKQLEEIPNNQPVNKNDNVVDIEVPLPFSFAEKTNNSESTLNINTNNIQIENSQATSNDLNNIVSTTNNTENNDSSTNQVQTNQSNRFILNQEEIV